MPLDTLSGWIFTIPIIIFFLGASIGSFLNLAAFRIPRSLSLWKPVRSFCDGCGIHLTWSALIPIVGYFLHHRRCPSCGTKVFWTYPIIEALTGLLTLFIFCLFALPQADTIILFLQEYLGYLFPLNREYIWPDSREGNIIALFTLLWILYSGILLSLIDFEFRILPNSIVLPGIPINIALAYLNPNVGFINSMIAGIGSCALLLGFCYLYFLVRKREGMGMGDVKYIAFFAFLLGPLGTLAFVLIATTLGSLVGVTLMIFQRKGLSLSLPFGPFLAIGGFLATFMMYLNK